MLSWLIVKPPSVRFFIDLTFIKHTINLGGVLMKEVEPFKYLGSFFTAAAQA